MNFDMGANEFSIDRELPVELTSHGSGVFEKDVPPPDFLSINPQGTELDIIRGNCVLEQHATLIQCEVTFFSLYQGLDDLCRYLHAAGYSLCALVRHTPYISSIIAGERLISPPIAFRRASIQHIVQAHFIPHSAKPP
jgi:hypothetical protein